MHQVKYVPGACVHSNNAPGEHCSWSQYTPEACMHSNNLLEHIFASSQLITDHVTKATHAVISVIQSVFTTGDQKIKRW